MADERVERKLTAILAADVAGYSRLMGADEAGTRARFNAHLSELIEPTIASYRGRALKAWVFSARNRADVLSRALIGRR